MSQLSGFGPPPKRKASSNIYTVLAAVAAVVLLAGVILLAMYNARRSPDGGPLTLAPAAEVKR